MIFNCIWDDEDCLFVNPNRSAVYKDLANDFAAIERPTSALLMSEYLNLAEDRFEQAQRENVEQMTRIKLKRQLLGDYYDHNENSVSGIFLRWRHRLSAMVSTAWWLFFVDGNR